MSESERSSGSSELVRLAVGCAVGFVWSVSVALSVLLDQALVTVSPGPGGGDWFPVWGALIAVPAAWVGGHGGIFFARRGWNPALRVAEACGVAAVAALVIRLTGGYASLPGAPFWSILTSSTPVYAVVGAWGAAARLARILWPRPVPSPEGAGVEGAGDSWRGVYVAVRAQLFLMAVALAGVWAIASYSVRGVPEAGGFVSTAGGLLFATCGLVLLASVHQKVLAAAFRREGVSARPGFTAKLPPSSLLFLITPAALALFLPANISPFHAWNFNNWMVRLTEWLGPLLVPSRAPARSFGEEISRFSIDRALWNWAEGGRMGSGSGGSLFFWIALLLLVSFIAWRIFRTPRRGERPGPGMGRLPLGLGWLFEQLKAVVVRFLMKWGFLSRRVGSGLSIEKVGAGGETPWLRSRRAAHRSVTALYVHVVGRMGRRGFAREEVETPLEFLERWKREHAAGDPRGLASLTSLYVSERYGERRPSAGVLAEARRAAAHALRALVRSRLAATVRSWLRRA